MKVREIENPIKFFSIVDRCQGDVELVSGVGDCINLKSKVTQMYTLVNVFRCGYVRELELSVPNPSDRELIDRSL
ncbi:hypothetical protein BXO88_09625 [Oribacterium sp. C9]|uniref:hypothetical protein n=1 Tax=Oribacterium sp. C9 TaxID=1943579 RepID=UPI00098EF2BD|nr:hypothetical protein [Oribacterium sp. C9]OON85885.1 hypothetical protein BXO88_09625 [Oribacterium sp. C9]